MTILFSPFTIIFLSLVLSVLLFVQWRVTHDQGSFVGFVGSFIFMSFYIWITFWRVDLSTSQVVGRQMVVGELCMFIYWMLRKKI